MSFQQHIRSIPFVNPNYWSFAITGKVRHPLILSYADLQTLPTQTLRCALACAGKSTDRPLIHEAEWRGVALETLLEQIEIDPAAGFAHAHSADGYASVLPLGALAGTLLAYAMDGAPLPPEHGFPVRLIAPGRFGYKMPKWISRIELHETAEGGFWESQGWSLEGNADARALILSQSQAEDGTIELAGVAYGAGREISSLHISIDGAGAMLLPFTPAEPFALTHWRTNWMPPGAGDYHVQLRASASGLVDAAEHAIVVRVR